MKQAFFIFPVLLLFMASCNNHKLYEEQILSLDSTRVELEKQIAVFQSLDTAKMSRYIDTYKQNVSWINENIKDTLEVAYLNALKNYRTVNEPLLFVKENYASIINDAKLSAGQLQKLATDMKNDAIEEARAFEYYTVEKSEAKNIMEALVENHKLATQSSDTFNKYNSEIEKLIAVYKNRNEVK